MNAQRKLQLGAAAVIANGLLAITMFAPRSALAVTCSDVNSCLCTISTCNRVAPPGCVATSFTCTSSFCGPAKPVVTCHYTPG